MSDDIIVPVLGDIVREWLRGDPLLDKHFFVHKEADWFQIRLFCVKVKGVAATHYADEFSTRWYIGHDKIELHPARPDFFTMLEKLLRQEHNRIQVFDHDCRVKL